mmetsp:Transcript_86811/g.280503  ORF Transcript_86811/g.280503 Transcript_86811/m.280503 type:complete len:82 (+) Transcript_86811:230-475(+)
MSAKKGLDEIDEHIEHEIVERFDWADKGAEEIEERTTAVDEDLKDVDERCPDVSARLDERLHGIEEDGVNPSEHQGLQCTR